MGLELSEWVAICDVFLGLMLNASSPFIISLHELGINNYNSAQAQRFVWLLTMLDTTVWTYSKYQLQFKDKSDKV